jgi:hypothetical protein
VWHDRPAPQRVMYRIWHELAQWGAGLGAIRGVENGLVGAIVATRKSRPTQVGSGLFCIDDMETTTPSNWK